MGRTGLLCALFYFLSLLCFMKIQGHRGTDRWLFFLSLLCFGLAILSKEEAISLPVVLLAILVLANRDVGSKRSKPTAIGLVPYFVLLGLYLCFRFYYFQGHYGQLSVYTNFDVRHMLANLATWVMGLLYPFDLYDARWAYENRAFGSVALPLVFLLLVYGGLAALLRPYWKTLIKDRLAWIGCIWFLAALAPIVGGNAHRWYLYIPSAGFCLLAAAVWRQKLRPVHRTGFVLFLAVLSAGYLVETYKQSGVWEKQSELSEAFMGQVQRHALYKLGAFDFINMPFGYKSSFLFTFTSLSDAIHLSYGTSPEIRVLSHLNLNDRTRVDVKHTDKGLAFSILPDATTYFIFPGLRRKVGGSGETMAFGAYNMEVQELTPSNMVRRYSVIRPTPSSIPLFYFDGTSIHKSGDGQLSGK